MILNFIGTVFIIILIAGIAGLFIFRPEFSAASGGLSETSDVLKMLLDIIPKNIVSPFADGNTLQIIFLAVVFGIAMLFLGAKTDIIAKTIEQINYIVQYLVGIISKLVPFFIYIVLLEMIWADSADVFLKVIRLFAVFLIFAVAELAGMIGYTSVKNRVSPLLLVGKGSRLLLIAFTTASSAASFGVSLNTCREKYGIDEKITSFGVPLGIVTFKPTTALSYVSMALFFAEMYSIRVSVSWVIVMIVSAGILTVATPPIPGGSITAYTVLFAQLGIPPEAIAIAVACDTLLDFVSTGFDQFMIPMALLNQSGKLGLVNRNVLLQKDPVTEKK